MKSSPASQGSSNSDRSGPQPGAAIQGRLSMTEDFLYTGARCIDRVFDLVVDRPRATLAVAVALLALVAMAPHG